MVHQENVGQTGLHLNNKIVLKNSGVNKQRIIDLPETEGDEPEEITLYREFLEVNQAFLNDWIEKNPYKPENLDEHNALFFKEYKQFLKDNKLKYQLTDKDISFWLGID